MHREDFFADWSTEGVARRSRRGMTRAVHTLRDWPWCTLPGGQGGRDCCHDLEAFAARAERASGGRCEADAVYTRGGEVVKGRQKTHGAGPARPWRGEAEKHRCRWVEGGRVVRAVWGTQQRWHWCWRGGMHSDAVVGDVGW